MSVWGWALPSTQALCPRPAKQLCAASWRQEPRAHSLQSLSGTQILLSPRGSLVCAQGRGWGG